MFPYWLLFTLVAAGAFGGGERRDWKAGAGAMFAIAGLGIVLMVGLRFEVGTDWGAYVRMFEKFRYLDFEDSLSLRTSEPAFGLINWLAHKLQLGVWAVNLTCAAIFTWGLLQFARRQPRPWLALLVAIPFLIIVVGMGYTRQSAALGFFMLALVALENRRSSTAVVLIIVAATFHTSALVTLPLIALSYARNRLQMGLLVILAAVIGYYTLIAPRFGRYSHGYIDQTYESEGAMVRLAMNLIPALIFLVARQRFDLDPVQKTLWRNIALMAVVSFALLFVLGSTVVLDRLALYIIPIQIFVLSRLPGLFAKSDGSSLLQTFFVIIYSATVQFIWLNYANHAKYWQPYRTVLTADAR